MKVNKRWIEFVIYFFFWGVLLLSPFWDTIVSGEPFPTWNRMLRYWLFISPAFLLFILNNYLFIPYLLEKKRIWQYSLSVIVLVFAANFLFNAVFPGVVPERRHFPPRHVTGVTAAMIDGNHPIKEPPSRPKPLPARGDMSVQLSLAFLRPHNALILLIVLVLSFNLCVRLSFGIVRNSEKMKELEKEALTAQLELLKYQINPHFLMNTLNNIHALIEIDMDRAQRSVIKLSKMMRYMLYDATDAFVELDKEVNLLSSYIELMRLRYNDKLKIYSYFPDDTTGVMIPSQLLISFLENAFKHGVAQNRPSEICMSLQIDGSHLHFNCRNTIGDVSDKSEKSNGIGIENARKRLSLLYNKDYVLDISKDDLYFNVSLKIPVAYDKMYNS